MNKRERLIREIAAISEAIIECRKRMAFHSGGTRREVEHYNLNELINARAKLESDLARIEGRSSTILAALD